MKRTKHNRTRVVVVNLLIATAVSVILNFSYFVFLLLSKGNAASHQFPKYVPINSTTFVTIEVVFYIVLGFVLLAIITSRGHYWQKILLCTYATLVMYFCSPHWTRWGGVEMLLASYRLFNPMALLKCSFTLIITALYGKIYELIYQKQLITIENEQLKNENISSRYNVLIGQINPHFFFNSLSSLAMLVREERRSDALTYIDRLSETFRYIIQTGQNTMTSLGEELKFVESYRYLFEMRYAGKLFIDIDIASVMHSHRLPSLALQPLIENAVKHNAITRSQPMHITIRTDGEDLIVENPIVPKIEAEASTGIGLNNLNSRYELLTGQNITIINDGVTFRVRLPLMQ